MKDINRKTDKPKNCSSVGMSLGLGLGLIWGIIFDNLPIGLLIGVCLSSCLGLKCYTNVVTVVANKI